MPDLNQHNASSLEYKKYSSVSAMGDSLTTLSPSRSDVGFVSTPKDVGSENPYAYISTRARVAIYDDLLSAPRVVDINPGPIMDFIESIASTTYECSKQQGGELPYTVIREIAENFIHASFKECTVSILNKGNTIHFSDQGPGIEKKRLVLQPGVSSAVADMKHYIRGVGSGLPIVREYLEFKRGHLSIEDNAKGGVVITLSINPSDKQNEGFINVSVGVPSDKPLINTHHSLDKRSLKALRLFYELGILGPSDLINPLEVSVTTAHRILVDLEKRGLIEHAPNRKRILTSAGVAFFEAEG